MTFVVRPATPADVAGLHSFIIELAEYEREPDAVTATPDDLARALFGGPQSLLGPAPTPSGQPALHAFCVDAPDGSLAGMAIWFLNYSTWDGKHGIYLEDLYVRPEFRGHGIGKLLLKELARTTLSHGYTRLQWWVLDWNEPAIEVYRRAGAVAMDEWTVYRVSGAALTELAAPTS